MALFRARGVVVVKRVLTNCSIGGSPLFFSVVLTDPGSGAALPVVIF